MDRENLIHDLINDVPELPEDLYTGISNRIRRDIRIRRTLYGAVALLILALVPLFLLQHKGTDIDVAQTVQTDDINNELQLVSEYLNAEDVDDYVALYITDDTYNEP